MKEVKASLLYLAYLLYIHAFRTKPMPPNSAAGAKYELPKYVLSEPSNLIKEE
jgi:hypothetical protein